MIGRKWKYKGMVFVMVKATYQNGNVEITTDLAGDKDRFTVSANNVGEFQEVQDNAVVLYTVPDKMTLEKLRTTVLASIETLKTNKEYIPQAQAINDTIKTLVELGKLELQALEMLNPRRKK